MAARQAKAEQYMRAIGDRDGILFGYYGWAQSSCAAPVNILLVLDPGAQTMWALELEPCTP